MVVEFETYLSKIIQLLVDEDWQMGSSMSIWNTSQSFYNCYITLKEKHHTLSIDRKINRTQQQFQIDSRNPKTPGCSLVRGSSSGFPKTVSKLFLQATMHWDETQTSQKNKHFNWKRLGQGVKRSYSINILARPGCFGARTMDDFGQRRTDGSEESAWTNKESRRKQTKSKHLWDLQVRLSKWVDLGTDWRIS